MLIFDSRSVGRYGEIAGGIFFFREKVDGRRRRAGTFKPPAALRRSVLLG